VSAFENTTDATSVDSARPIVVSTFACIDEHDDYFFVAYALKA